MRREFAARPEYAAAFAELARRIAAALASVSAAALPIRMYVAGGAALHFHTGARVSVDVDAAFSRRVALPANLDVAYREADGSARLLYFDRQYTDTLALLHEDAYGDAQALTVQGVDPCVLDVRILSPLDLAVSKLARYSAQDREDVLLLARLGLYTPAELQQRASAALGRFVGDTVRLRGQIDDAVRRAAGLMK